MGWTRMSSFAHALPMYEYIMKFDKEKGKSLFNTNLLMFS